MPEGHTVHRLARLLRELFAGSPVRVTSPQGRFAAGASLLDGGTVVAAEAWGKQLFVGFAPGPAGETAEPEHWLRVHLGLYGAWTFAGDASTDVVHAIGAPRRRIGERDSLPAPEPSAGEWTVPEPRGAVRVRLLGRHAVADLTGPTACEVLTPAEKAGVEARLGPDPIRTDGGRGSLDAARDAFVERVRRSRVTVGQQLMDQAVVAGVGNIYRAEALFRAGVDPLVPGREVPAEVLGALWDDLVVLMRDGADTGRIVTTRPEHRSEHPGTGAPAPQRRPRQNTDGDAGAVASEQAFYVYHRDGLPCRVCGAPVLLKELAGRNLFWCGVCEG
ncbi:endonuclease-8 [Isoptericola sp. CG 20/1183]|uniref:DNA-(apurinic or apyrimidinic site) lyase n=1 Tax=Isoptericola halotolerans TaxID=300560 RepID=A0ABX5EEJ2_9MICO|nr:MULTISPECIES: DNA-formamidopyrimidine glycosylase family protein [Isoptericola]PRZ07565.1 endonuclease-8 [Isoptericola halotolerans]PRZ08075.1 endonuclease-8 [Isoptericola sp. CG 20/1183]